MRPTTIAKYTEKEQRVCGELADADEFTVLWSLRADAAVGG